MNNNFYYDPQKQGYDTTVWQTISGAPAVVGNVLTLNAASCISQADLYSAEVTMNVKVPVTPVPTQDKRFGLAQLNLGAFVGFRITDNKFYIESEGGANPFTPQEVTWDVANWTNKEVIFKIVWNNFNVEFWIGTDKIAVLNAGQTPNVPLGIYLKNVNADALGIKYVEVRNANIWAPTNHITADVAIDPGSITIGAVDVNPPSTLLAGSKTVAVPGTAEALGASQATKSIYIRAKTSNTQNVYVGDSTVDKTTSQQIILTPGSAVGIDIANRASVFVDADIAVEGVDYLLFI